MKRILSLILALVLCVSTVPGKALAEMARGELPEATEEVSVEETAAASEEEPTEEATVEETEEATEASSEEPTEETAAETAGEAAYTLTIAEEPEDTLILEGAAFFYVSADVLLGENLTEEIPLYQWQRLEGDTWVDLPGQTDQVLVLEDLAEDSVGSVYRCMATFGGLEAISQTAAITGLAPAEEAGSWGDVTFINPLYEDVLTEADLPQVSMADTYAEEETFTRYASQEAAAVAMKQALLGRQASFSAEFQLDASNIPEPASYMRTVYYGSVNHTGVPTEGDYLRYEFGGYKGYYSWDDSTYIFRCTYNFLYYTTAAQEAELDKEVSSVLAELDLTEKAPKEKVDAIYGYLCQNVVYDHKNKDNKTYTLQYTAYAALMNGTAVCQGYAAAFYRLCLESGVDTRIVTSNAMNHAWNIVNLGRFYYCVDATWDANHQENYLYYLKGSDYWLEKHKIGNKSVLGDEFSDSSFSENYPVPKENYEEVSGGYFLREDGTLVLTEAYSPKLRNFAASYLDGVMVTNAPWRAVAEQVRRIEFPKGITYIGSNAFQGLTNLEELEIPNTVKRIEDGAFAGCTGLTALPIPYGVEAIGSSAFRGLSQLEALELPEGLDTIEDEAFRDCTGLKTLTIRSGPSLGTDVFAGCPIENLTLPAEWNAARLKGALDGLKTLNLTEDGSMASYTQNTPAPWSGTGLEEVTFEPDLQQIGSYGFQNCQQLKTLTLPQNLRQIGTGAFSGCTGLKELTLPGKLTRIYSKAFDGCESTLTFTGQSLPTLDRNAFAGAKLTCLYPCTWKSAPTGVFGGTVTWKMDHRPEYVPGQPITETADGLLEHWKCPLCGRMYQEESCNTELTQENVVLYRESYTITYVDMEDADNPNPGAYVPAKGLTLKNADRTGYLFGGWYTDEARSRKLTAIPVNTHGDMTLYPKWTAIRYTLAFHANGGSGSAARKALSYEADAVLPESGFRRTGYRLSGWNTEKDGTGNGFRLGETVRNLTDRNNASVTLFAQWEPITYTLLLNPNDGKTEALSQELRYGEEFLLTGEMGDRTGWHIAAWTLRPDGRGTGYTAGKSVKNLASTDGAELTLYGKWAVNNYTVVFHSNDPAAKERRQVFTYDRAAILAGNGFARIGYTFVGWSTEPEGAVVYTNKAQVKNLTDRWNGTVDLYAVWTPITYKVAFRANGASGEMDPVEWTYDQDCPLPEMAFTRPGFTFLGWGISASGKVLYSPGQEVKNLTSVQGRTVTLYALWRAHSYEIRFHGGDGTTGVTRTMAKLYCGRVYALNGNGFRKTGYDFAGWKDESGKDYRDRCRDTNFVLEDGGVLDLYAQWTPHPYTITYRNCIAYDENPNSTVYDAETDVTFRAPVRAGTEFLGWYLDSRCTRPVDSTRGLFGNQIVYAKWGPAPSYTIHFEGGPGATGRTADMTGLVCGRVYSLRASGYRRAGYSFAGWSRTPDGKVPEYQNKAQFGNLWQENGEGLTLYAVWFPITYRITYQKLIAADENPNPATFTVEDTVVLEAPTRPGCTFLGWYLDASFRKPIGEITAGAYASNLTLYAKWENGGRSYGYTIVFDGNGASSGRMNPMTGRYNGAIYTLNANGFRRTGYTFLGWSLDPDADTPTWTNRARVGNLADREGQTVTLYAVWKK